MLNERQESRQSNISEIYNIMSNGNNNCIFIPAKDMLTHSKGFISMSKKYKEFPFDITLIGIIEKAQQWQLKKLVKL